MKNIILCLIFVVFLSSCVSRLKVTVETANRDLVVKEYSNKESLPNLLALENFVIDWNKSEILKDIFFYLEKPDINKKSFPLDIVAEENIEKEFDIQITPFFNKVKDYTCKSRIAFDKNELLNVSELNNLANFNIQEIISILKEYNVGIENKIVNVVDNSKILKNISGIAHSGSRRTKFTVLGDPLVSYITKEKNECLWESIYNKTVSWNVLGNADVAVILRTNPPENELKSGDYNNNFSIKGVRLDTSDAVNTILTSLTQTINFVANINGIPLKTPAADSANSTPTPNENIANSQVTLNNIDSKKRKLQDYRKMVIEKIKLENIEELTDSVKIKAASIRIEAFWAKLKIELNK